MTPELSDKSCKHCGKLLWIVARDELRFRCRKSIPSGTLDILRCESCDQQIGYRYNCGGAYFLQTYTLNSLSRRGFIWTDEDNPGFENAVRAIESLGEGEEIP